MRVAIIIPQRGFKDESVAVTKELLEKWHVETVIASYASGNSVGYHGAVVKVDQNAALIKTSDFDAIVLVDGPGIDQFTMYDFRPLLDTVKHFAVAKKIVAGIGNAVKVIARANIIADTKIALPRDEETRRLAILYRGALTKNYLEFDKNILTLSTPDKIDEFANMLLDKLGVK